MSQFKKQNKKESNKSIIDEKYINGVVLSFDFKTSELKKYYSKKSPTGAYSRIRTYLKNNGFIHLGDSDYMNEKIDDIITSVLLTKFASNNKWFPLCVKKIHVSPNVERLDTSEEIKLLIDDDFKLQKEKEYNEN